MVSRSSNLRRKVVALLASLVALWAFAAWVTLREGANLLWVQTLDSRVAQPGEPLILELQAERRAATAYLGAPGGSGNDQFSEQWSRTQVVVDEFRSSARGWWVSIAASDDSQQQIDTVLARLDRLDEVRDSVQSRQVDRAAAAEAYTDLIDELLAMYRSLGNLDDEQFAQDTRTLIQLVQARELISQEDALVTGVLAAGRITPEEVVALSRAVGVHRYLDDRARADLPDGDREQYEALQSGATATALRAQEDKLLRDTRASGTLPLSAEQWRAAVDPAMEEQQRFILTAGDALVERAIPIAVGVILRLVLAAGLGLLAVIASIVVSITTARAVLAQLERLRDAAFRLAHERLPSVVERLGRGDDVDVAAEAPPLEFGDDEIGQVGKAFNAVQETAIRTAVEQAELRRNVREVFLSLARRTQALVHRQLTLLDAMERREQDAEELEDLFRVDHLATRMRRNAENLIVLSGATPGRAWRRNVPMVDVVRGAVAEVEDYTRVTVLPIGAVSLAGRAVGDVIHLLAELIENGLSFSPPHTIVEVRGQLVANGFVIEIEDRGLGMSEDDLAAANQRIVDRSELNLANASRLGLYVVSRLTERHGVRVQLKESAYGGTTAVVLIPGELVTAEDDASTSGGFLAGTGGTAGLPAGGGVAAEERPAPSAPVALAEPPAAPRPRPVPESGVDDGLPVRSRGRALAEATSEALPVRPRGGSGALDGPTVPASLPVTAESATTAAPETHVGTPPATTVPAGAAPAEPATAPAETASGEPETAPTEPAGTAVAEEPAAADVPEEPTGSPQTESGLPVRVRQANIAPELRDEPAEADTVDIVRPPEQVRRMMSSYQTGTRRGRTDAARLLGAGDPPDAGPDPGDQQAT